MRNVQFVISIAILFIANLSFAAVTVKMNHKNAEITDVVEIYSKATGQRFVMDPGVRGRITILGPEMLPQEEAFNQLSSALATNGYAISKQGDTMLIKSARNIQRDYIEVSAQKPSLKPERMYTWVYTVKNVPAMMINRDLRILCSRDGEMSVSPSGNQIIITDWTSNLNRIADLMVEIDKKPSAEVKKLVDEGMKMHPPQKQAGPPPKVPDQKVTE